MQVLISEIILQFGSRHGIPGYSISYVQCKDLIVYLSPPDQVQANNMPATDGLGNLSVPHRGQI